MKLTKKKKKKKKKFLNFFFFFLEKKSRVGPEIFGSVGEPETQLFLFFGLMKMRSSSPVNRPVKRICVHVQKKK